MKYFSRNPVRWLIALALIPVGPHLVYWIAIFGKQLAESTHVKVMTSHPEAYVWIFVVFGAFFPATLLGLLISSVSGESAKTP